MRLKTVVRSIMGVFWALELSTIVFGLNIQINHAIELLYGFGPQKVLAWINSPEGLWFSQNLSVHLEGKVAKGFYLSGDIGGNSISNLVLHYTPEDLSFGTVRTVSYGTNEFSIVGFSSPIFSFGQLRGSIKRTIFKIEDPSMPIILGPIAYQSVQIYLNGIPIPLSECTINYNKGEIFVPNLVRGDVVTVEYQSVTTPSSSYVTTLRDKEKTKDYILETSIFAIFDLMPEKRTPQEFPAPTNQFFAFAKLLNIMPSFSLSTYINMDNFPSFKIEATSRFSIDGTKFVANAGYNTKGFRKPLGVAMNEGGSLSISAQNSYGDVKIESNGEALQVSVDASKTKATFYIGKNPNIALKFSSNTFRFGLSAGSSEVESTEKISSGDISLSFDQHFGKKFEMKSKLSVSTPITLEASFNSKEIGLKISKSFGLLQTTLNWQKDNSGKEEMNLNIGNQWLWSEIPISVDFSLYTSPSTLTTTLNANADTNFGKISLSIGNSPFVNLTLAKDFGETKYSLETKFDEKGVAFNTSVTGKLWGLNVSGGFTVAMVDGQIGGKISLKVGE